MTTSTGSGRLRGAEVRTPPPPARRQAWKLYLLILISITPVIASYLAYYVFPPAERTNYGALIEPQRPVPEIASELIHPPAGGAGEKGAAGDGGVPGAGVPLEGLGSLKGRWIMLAIDRGACELPCAEKLFFMRQTHVSLGKERGRMVRVLLLVDQAVLPAPVVAAHPDLIVFQVRQEDLATFIPVEAGSGLADHIFIVDPLQNLMMRFPPNPDPGKTRRDLQKLLKASRIG